MLSFTGLQSYVLDVHPFNPRIAMSAGYDGRTIVWDVSFLSFRSLNLNTLCCHVLHKTDINLCFFIYSFSRYGRVYLFGHMKLDGLSWLMGSFLRKCLSNNCYWWKFSVAYYNKSNFSVLMFIIFHFEILICSILWHYFEILIICLYFHFKKCF